MTRRVVIAGLLLCAALAGCTASPSESGLSAQTVTDSPTVAAIRATIDEINATAGGPVTAQRAVLQARVTVAQSADQLACPTAANTLSFEPAYGDLRPAPDDPDGGFVLPAYITIYTGDRIIGSDLTSLHLWIVDGRARTAALCVA